MLSEDDKEQDLRSILNENFELRVKVSELERRSSQIDGLRQDLEKTSRENMLLETKYTNLLKEYTSKSTYGSPGVSSIDSNIGDLIRENAELKVALTKAQSAFELVSKLEKELMEKKQEIADRQREINDIRERAGAARRETKMRFNTSSSMMRQSQTGGTS
jgi:regulator of replication initiation timing